MFANDASEINKKVIENKLPQIELGQNRWLNITHLESLGIVAKLFEWKYEGNMVISRTRPRVMKCGIIMGPVVFQNFMMYLEKTVDPWFQQEEALNNTHSGNEITYDLVAKPLIVVTSGFQPAFGKSSEAKPTPFVLIAIYGEDSEKSRYRTSVAIRLNSGNLERIRNNREKLWSAITSNQPTIDTVLSAKKINKVAPRKTKTKTTAIDIPGTSQPDDENDSGGSVVNE